LFFVGNQIRLEGRSLFVASGHSDRPRTYLILNYAERLLGGERVSVLEADLDQTVDRLVRAISQGELDYLKGIQSTQVLAENRLG
jgi:hypothetical protein